MVNIYPVTNIAIPSVCKSAIVTYIILVPVTSVIPIISFTIILVSTILLEMISGLVLILITVYHLKQTEVFSSFKTSLFEGAPILKFPSEALLNIIFTCHYLRICFLIYSN